MVDASVSSLLSGEHIKNLLPPNPRRNISRDLCRLRAADIYCCRKMISASRVLAVKTKSNFAKETILILADLEKLKKYKRRIDSVPVELEVRISLLRSFCSSIEDDTQHSVKIIKILHEVMADVLKAGESVIQKVGLLTTSMLSKEGRGPHRRRHY